MCKLSETSEWWTSLSTSHDERIMTAIAKQSKEKVQSNGKCNSKFCELASSKAAENFLCPRVRDDDSWRERERADAFSEPRLCWYIDVFEFCGSFRDSAHESGIKGANHVRGGASKSTLVVDNDSVHTSTVAFSPQSWSSVVSVLTHPRH